jgi:hypothetical protein
MRHEIRLVDQNLPGFVRELAMAGWNAVNSMLPEDPGKTLYRSLYRAVRRVFRERVMAFRFCGGAMTCEHTLERARTAPRVAHERWPGEHIRIFLTGPEVPPEALMNELLQAMLRAVVARFPGKRLHGVAPALKLQLEKAFRGRIFRSESCGQSPLCGMNEAYDPWDMRDPQNLLGHQA